MIQDTGGTCPKTWSAGPLVQKLDSRSLGRCPWFQCPRFWQVALSAGDYRTGVVTPTQTLQPEQKSNGQLTGDCLTGLGLNRNGENQKGSSAENCSTSFVHNRNGKNQRGSSPETARLVLVPTKTGKTNSSSPETARPVLVTQPKGKTINPGSSPDTARLVLVPTETEKTNSSSPENCSTSFGHSTQREDNQPLTQHGRGARKAQSCSQ